MELEGCLRMSGLDGQDLWLRIGAVGALSVKNPAPSEPDIRKHPSSTYVFMSCEGI